MNSKKKKYLSNKTKLFNVKKLIETLRSGKYTKTKGTLRRVKIIEGEEVPCFCMQGVIADMAINGEFKGFPKEVTGKWSGDELKLQQSSKLSPYTKYTFNDFHRFAVNCSKGFDFLLPEGFSSNTSIMEILMSFNDSGTKSLETEVWEELGFEEIADILELEFVHKIAQ